MELGEQLDKETRTLQVRVAVPNQQGLLKPEMYATAAFQQSVRRPALFVPEQAVQDINGVPAVFVRRSSNQFESRAVQTGQRSNGEVEILDGLKPQEQVVVKGSFMLKSELLKNSIKEE
jgi:cobalt-zinc-cadmium efflux system membrane fusion protein